MNARIARIELQTGQVILSPGALAAEQQAALHDLLALSHFRPLADEDGGPYDLRLSIAEGRLLVAVRNARAQDLSTLVLSLKPYRRLIDDYFLMIRSFEEARHTAAPCRLEAIDMGRRGLHNEGAELLIVRLRDKIEIDFDTARRLFTLICALHRDQIRTLG